MNIWDALINQPLAALLLFLYNLTNNYGVAIILFCVVTKVLLLFFSAKGKRGMMRQQRLAPKQAELQKQYGKDKQKYNEMLMKLYQDEGVSPMGGCLWSLLPWPIFIALFSMIREPLKNLMKLTAEQIQNIADYFGVATTGAQAGYYQLELAQKVHENYAAVMANVPGLPENMININFDFWSGFNLSVTPNAPWQGGLNWFVLLPLLSGAFAYLSSFLMQKFSGNQNQPQGGMKVMFMLMPLMSVYFGFIMPAAMSVYWITNSVLGIIQEYFLTKHYRKVMDEEDRKREELRERRKAAEEAQKQEERERREKELAERKAKHKTKTYRVKNNPGKK